MEELLKQLIAGQKQILGRMDHIEKEQIDVKQAVVRLEKEQTDTKQAVVRIEKEQSDTKQAMARMEKEQADIKQAVVRMENQHGEKLAALYDAREVQLDVNERIFDSLNRIEGKIDRISLKVSSHETLLKKVK
ncbi:MAG: hypothetical protein ABFC84_18900 [Veillonellales bacterium]